MGCSVSVWRSGSGNAHQFVVTRDQVAVLIKVADDEFGGLAHLSTNRNRAQLPGQVIRKIAGLGKKILERGSLDLLHFAGAAVARVKVVLEKRTEVNLFEGILLLFGGRGSFFRRPFAVFFAAADLVEQGDGIFQFFEYRIFHHLGSDHVPQLELVERKHRDHLHQTRS